MERHPAAPIARERAYRPVGRTGPRRCGEATAGF